MPSPPACWTGWPASTMPPEQRPRDALGRPLPLDADPSLAVAGIPEHARDSDAAAWLEAVAYLEGDRPFHAHEVFEMRWRAAPSDTRAAWRGLAQWGAALTHRARGNDVGAARLADRALRTLADAPRIPPDVDLDRVTSSCLELGATLG